jgi:hypothetical protein
LKRVLGSTAAILGFGLMMFAQAPPAPKDIPQDPGPNPRELSAHWVFRDVPGYMPSRETIHPEFTPEYKQELADQATARARTGAPAATIPAASGACMPMGMPFMMTQHPALNVVQGKNEILMLSEQHSSARHIYLDGRTHPAPEYLQRTTNGHSIGHWEGNVLAVDTVGFIDNEGMTGVPGGAVRESTSHLVERFHLVDGGTKLWYDATWDDPKIYAKPLTLTYIYFRMPSDTFSIEEGCDAGESKQHRLY